jgi:hypothetical protein
VNNGPRTNRTPSFVSKHFQIQRRKTIHDIVNFEILNNIVSSESSPTNSDVTTSDMNIHKYQSSNVRLNKMQLLEEKFPETSTERNEELEDDNQIHRSLIRKTHVQLLNVNKDYISFWLFFLFHSFSIN